MPTDHRTALNMAGVNHARVVAIIHGHPQHPIGYPGPLYTQKLPAYGLMPSPRSVVAGAIGVERVYGDWVSHQYWIDQIAAAGGRTDLFRQYIVGWGAYERMERPKWHLTEPRASLCWIAEDYANDLQNKRPPYPLPIGAEVEIRPN